MKKYYIEIWHNDMEFEKPYAFQSKWFDEEQDALDWLGTIEYIDSNFSISLMSAEFDKDGNMIGDIEFNGNIGIV